MKLRALFNYLIPARCRQLQIIILQINMLMLPNSRQGWKIQIMLRKRYFVKQTRKYENFHKKQCIAMQNFILIAKQIIHNSGNFGIESFMT